MFSPEKCANCSPTALHVGQPKLAHKTKQKSWNE